MRVFRDFLGIKLVSNSPLIDRDIFLDLLEQVYVIWKSDIEGIVDLNSPVFDEVASDNSGFVNQMLAGIVNDELFLRPELDAFFTGRADSDTER